VQCARLGVPPLLLDRMGEAGGLVRNGHLIENYPGLEEPLPGRRFAARMREHLGRFGVEVAKATVGRIQYDGDAWLVELDDDTLRARCAMLATGTSPVSLPVEGGRSPARARVFTQVVWLLDAVPSPRRVIVVGGGEAAFDQALSLADAGAEVSVLVRGEAPRARGRLAAMVEERPEIAVETGASLAAIAPREDGIGATVETRAGEEGREVDAVLTAIGRVSSARGLLGPLAGEIETDLLEPARGLFLCGDVRSGVLGHAGMAVGDGLAAASLAVRRLTEGER
jgi:thioredoxin reductase (NADPH)